MKRFTQRSITVLGLLLAASPLHAQAVDAARLRELRQKAQTSSLTAEEKAELDKGMKARSGGRTEAPGSTPRPTARATPPPGSTPRFTARATPAPGASPRPTTRATPAPATPAPTAPGATPRPAAAAGDERRAQYAERQEFSLQRMRDMGKVALEAAAARPAPSGAAREYYVNNESGNDQADGLAAEKAVKTLAKGVSFLKPGDTLHLAVTSQPYRETLRLNDDFGGVPGKPITIEGHGATLDGCDPLRLDGWTEAGGAGLYKSTNFMSELEEFTDEAKLMRVFFLFDGVVQHMGRSSKGMKGRFRAPSDLKAGEWTYAESEKAFYLKVAGKLADAKVEAPYRRNGVAVRAPKVAATNVVIKDMIVCHVLNDGFNIHGTTKDFFMKNIAAYECGDDGISPHETCEVTIDGFWSVGNSTGMGNGNLSVTKATNIRLEGNLAHQLMTGHAPINELKNVIIIAQAGTQPINITNAQSTVLKMDNAQISAPSGQKMLNVPNGSIEARRLTIVGPDWENAGAIRITESAIAGGKMTNLPGGTWSGEKNVYALAFGPEAQNSGCVHKEFGVEVLKAPQQPFPGAGAVAGEFKIPPRPVPHKGAGKFTCFEVLAAK